VFSNCHRPSWFFTTNHASLKTHPKQGRTAPIVEPRGFGAECLLSE
jgi:hypothetical protein